MITRKRWTPEEEQILMTHYGCITTNNISKKYLPHRSKTAIKLHAMFMGLDGNRKLLTIVSNTKYSDNTTEKPCSQCKLVKPISDYHKFRRRGKTKYRYDCKTCQNEYLRLRRSRLKKQIIEKYGAKCHCRGCGEERFEFLTIEHVFGGGTKHRKKRGDVGMLMDIIRSNYSSEYTVLCYNCNCAKAHSEDNICPHENESFI
jgi:transposase-like protein